MKKLMATALCTLFVAALWGLAPAGGMNEAAKLKLGGQLYDNWPAVTGQKPVGQHPLYPAGSKKKGVSTWRCKECHGWDYIGLDGRYSSGSHYTGIKGVMGVAGRSNQEITNALADGAAGHDFSAYLRGTQLRALALFLSQGLIDINDAIDEQGRAKGDIARGKALYGDSCAACHGAEGDQIDFNSGTVGAQGVGWLVRKNPQETLHKIRWGHPGSSMPSGLVDSGMTDAEMVSVLAYAYLLK